MLTFLAWFGIILTILPAVIWATWTLGRMRERADARQQVMEAADEIYHDGLHDGWAMAVHAAQEAADAVQARREQLDSTAQRWEWQ